MSKFSGVFVNAMVTAIWNAEENFKENWDSLEDEQKLDKSLSEI